MTILTANGKPVDIAAGIESLTADLSRLQAYKAGYISSGLESMDYPAGNLIESGLAAKYPDHFTIGSGIEGIDKLIARLTSGIEGLTLIMEKGPEEPEPTNAVVGKPDNVQPPEDGSVVIDKPVTTPDTELQPQNPDA